MTDEISKPENQATPLSVPWTKPEEGICEIYSNFYHLNWTVFDVRIRFGQIVPNPDDPPESAHVTVTEQAAITMPWGQIKALRDMLIDIVGRYEAVNGEIKVPKLPI